MSHHLSLRTRFIAFAVICLIPLLIVVVFFLDRSADRSNQEVINSEATLASLVSQSLTNYLNLHFQTIERLASVPSIQSQEDIDEVNGTLGQARTLRSDMSGVFLVNPEGDLVAESGTDADLVLPYISSQIESTIATGQRSISRRIDLDGETHVLVLLAPVTAITQTQTTTTTQSPTETPVTNDDASNPVPTPTVTPEGTPGTQPPGAVLGVIGSVIQVDNLSAQAFPVLRTRTEIVILSGDQIITGTGDIRQNEQGFLNLIERLNIRAGDSGTDVFEMTSDSGTERIATYAPIQMDAADWAVIVSNPRPGTYGDSLWLEGSLILVMASLAIVSIALAVGEYTSRPLRDLAEAANRIEEGDHHVTVLPYGTDEMRNLSKSLNQISERLNGQTEGLEQSQAERQRQTDQMRDLLRRTLRLQEDERRRIASEIHDAVSPLITGALYQSRALEMSNGANSHEKLAESLQGVNGLLERASEELHGVIFDLRPPDLDDIGVVAALEVYVSTIQRTGLEARLEVVNELPPQTPEVRLGIYRIVQEALHNVLRHASADEAVVRIEFDDDLLRVTIRDNGIGFDPATAARPTSLGMLSMRERAAAIGARFSIISRPGAGTAIILERTETGNVMSDDIFNDLIRHRDDGNHVVEQGHSGDNTGNDVPDTSDEIGEGHR
jgi:signal transduction histidine kinase